MKPLNHYPPPHIALPVIIIATLLALWPVITFDFVGWDDYETVARNPKLNPPTQESLISFWTQPQMELYVPVTYTLWSFVANLAIQPPTPPANLILNPRVFHTTNLALHLAAATVVFFFLKDLMSGVTIPAAAGALLFALHPVQVEPVAWISGMKDLLCGLLSLVALWQYHRYAKLRSPGAEPSLPSERWQAYGIAIACFALALLAKPTAVVVPLVAAMLDWIFVRRPIGQILKSLSPWLVLSMVCAAIAKWAQPALHVADVAAPFWARPLVALDALAFYLFKLVWPARLAFDYGRNPQLAMERGWVYYTWLAPIVLAALVVAFRKKAPALLAAALIFVLCLAPVLGLVPFDFQASSTVTDHYLYLPMLGVALAASWGVSRMRHPAALFAAAIVLTLLGARSYCQTWHWRDSQTLFDHALAVNPASFISYTNLATARIEADDAPQAVALARRAVNIRPRFGPAYFTLGLALSRQGDRDGAIAAYRTSLQYDRGDSRSMSNLAAALFEKGETDEAVKWAEKAVELDPSDASYRVNLGTIYDGRRRGGDAISQFRQAVRLAPRNVRARTNLAVLLIRTGQTAEAREHLRAALQADPTFTPAQQAMTWLQQSSPPADRSLP